MANGNLRSIGYGLQIITANVSSLTQKQLQLLFDDNTALANFESQPLSSKNSFSLESNLWQIPAGKKESNVEIKNRLINHLKFWENYLAGPLITIYKV